jgi:hypothetical protein
VESPITFRPAWLAGILAGIAFLASGQQTPDTVVLPDERPSAAGVLPCLRGVNFETEKYRIGKVTVDDPFKFLYWIGGRANSVEAQIRNRLQGQLFTYKAAGPDAIALIDATRFVPDIPGTFVVSFEKVSVLNCNSAAKTLDVVYRVYSTAPPRAGGGATETQKQAETSPQDVTGLTKAGSPLRLVPAGGYNAAWGAFAGGNAALSFRAGGLFDTFSLRGQASTSGSMRSASTAISGSASPLGPIQLWNWRLNYANDSTPAGSMTLSKANGSGQFDAQTRPFWNGAVFARFGALAERGIMQSATQITTTTTVLPPNTVASAAYGSLKGFAGLSSRTGHNTLSVSYGLEFGSIGPSARVDWRKHIGDVVDEFWIPLGDHKPLEVESRFTAGAIQVPHTIPLAARFFGGNGDGYFIPGDSWQIRDVPVIRAIPANQFYRTGQGAGADQFAAVNLTLSYPVKHEPIMPKDLSTDPEFNQLMAAQIVSAASAEQNYYSWKDPHFAMASAELPKLAGLLDTLDNAVNAAQTAHPDLLPDEFSDCSTQLFTASFNAKAARDEKKVAQYGDVAVLLPADPEDDLKAVHDSCAVALNGQLKDAAVAAGAADVDAEGAKMFGFFNAIDQKGAAAKAANDIAFVKRTLNTVFKDLNIFSISPVFVFDAATIGPASGPLGGTRIGPGGGVRLELASYVNFTLGYAWNVDHKVNEDKGAVFFSIGTRDLFH